ncbi:MAG: ArsR/SmtB family transcription factor [Bacillota bacterium]
MVKTPAQPDALLGWMEGLADPTRLRLLRLLEQHELGVVELCDVLQLPQSTVSRHLKVLGDRGFVRNHREGTTHLYRMVADELAGPARRLWLLARDQTQGWATCRQDELRLERRLRDRQADSQAFFAGAAGQWDKLRAELYGQSFTLSAMLSLLPANYVVADLGCGTGPIIAQLTPYIRRVIGVDNSLAMLKAARKRLAGAENVELLHGDVAAVPIEDCTCDAVLLILALTYVPDPAGALREMARILKPGGRAVIVDLLPHDREEFRRQMGQTCLGFEPSMVESMMAAAGLEYARVRPLAPEPNVKGPALFLATAQRPKGDFEAKGR